MKIVRRSLGRLVIGSCIACMLGGSGGLMAEELSSRQLNKLDRQAGKALDEGRWEEARQLFEQVLTATEPADARRAEALFGMLRLEIWESGEVTPVAEGLLDELLSSFPDHPQRRQIELFDRWRHQTNALKLQLAASQQALAEQVEACEAMTGELTGAAGEKEGQMQRDNQRLRRDLSALRQQLEATQTELGKKEEALEKLKDALVGGG